MKAIVIAALLALSFTTGFTCSKNQPTEAPMDSAPAVEETTPDEGMPSDEGTTETAPEATPEEAPAE